MSEQWDSSLYDDRHSFVWKAGTGLFELLDPKPGERILDLGCGTGHLTAQIAARGADVVGMDLSLSMVAQARQNYPKLKFVVGDARDFLLDQPVDAVFSNAVLHWVPEAGRVIGCIAAALKPGGRFVMEMGGRGNIANIVGALHIVLPKGRNPWYYPSAAEYAALLEEHDFEVNMLSTFERWTRLEHPEKGLREWLEMFAGTWLDGARPDAVARIEELLRPRLYCDGAWWADYKRLRVIASAARLPLRTQSGMPMP
jgi:trans-aconitate methyltransferase